MARQRAKPPGSESRPRRPARAEAARNGIRSVARAGSWTARAPTEPPARTAHVVARTARTAESATPGTAESAARSAAVGARAARAARAAARAAGTARSRTLLGHAHGQGAPVQVVPVELPDGDVRFRLGAHLHEAKT